MSTKPRAKRARRLKVYAVDLFVSGHGGRNAQQCRVVVAAYTQVDAAKAFGVTPYYLGAWGCTTGNDHDIEVAMGEPGTVYSKPLDDIGGELRATVLVRNSLWATEEAS